MDKEQALVFVNEFYYNDLKFCGCGNPEHILLVIKKVLEIIKNKKEMTYDEYKVQVDNFIGNTTQENIAYGIWQFILNVLDEALVIEHGGSINHSWLTSKGEELLKALNMIDDLQEMFFI